MGKCFVLLLLSISALAAERPTLPLPGEDKAALEGRDAESFFADREKNTECRGRLAPLLAAWRAEKSLPKFRALLPVLQECGPCRAQKVEARPVETGARKENWYISSGRCLLPGDAQARRAGFAKLAQSLKILKRYPARHGGFPDLLEFRGVDGESGALLPEVAAPIEASPFFAFIAVRGPEAFGVKTAATYLVKNDLVETEHTFQLDFRSVRPPDGFEAPELPYTELAIPTALGQWYLASNGYLRYFTAADFPLTAGLVAELAQRILLATLLEAVERGS